MPLTEPAQEVPETHRLSELERKLLEAIQLMMGEAVKNLRDAVQHQTEGPKT